MTGPIPDGTAEIELLSARLNGERIAVFAIPHEPKRLGAEHDVGYPARPVRPWMFRVDFLDSVTGVPETDSFLGLNELAPILHAHFEPKPIADYDADVQRVVSTVEALLDAQNRANLQENLRRFGPNLALITFAGIGTHEVHSRLPSLMPRLRVTANDIERLDQSYAPGARLLNERDARKILRFVAALPPGIETLLVQCQGGASRSVAVVAALHYLRYGKTPPPFLANRHIYETIVRVGTSESTEAMPT